jgi:hypothetical protein
MQPQPQLVGILFFSHRWILVRWKRTKEAS